MSRPHNEWSERASPLANARRRLPRMMAEYFAEVRAALADKQSPAHLHCIRLASKKVRYTLELFRPCYGAVGFDARLQALKDVQGSLGDVNDAVAASQLLAKLMPHSASRRELRAFLKQRAAKKAEEFGAHWTGHFDAPGRERWWTDFLGGRHGAKNRRQVHRNRTGAKPSR